MRILLTNIFFLSFFSIYAMNIDSLKVQLSKAENTEKIDILNQLYKQTKYTDLASAIVFAHESIKISKLLKDTFNLGVSFRNLGNTYSYKGYTELSMRNYQNSLTQFKNLKNELEIAKTRNNIANVYAKINNTKLALENYNKSFYIIRKLGETKYYSSFYLNISHLYTKIGEIDTALVLLKKVKILYKEEGLANITVPAKYNSSMADCYLFKNKLDSALYYYKIANALAEKGNLKFFLETAYYQTSMIYLRLDKYNQAEKYFLKSLKLSLKSGNLENQSNAYKGLNSLYTETRKFRLASKYMNEYVTIKDSLYKKGSIARIEELRLLYNLETKNKEITLLEKNNKIALLKSENANAKTKQILYLIIILIMVIISISFILIIQARKKLLSSKLEQNELKNSYLKKEIQFKTTQLTDFALYIIKRNDFFREITNHLKKLKKKAPNDILADIRNIEELIKYSINISKDRKEFNSQVELVNQEFYERIENKYPELTKNERNIAILLKLNLSSKEIASILNVSSKSIDNYRYNIRKKLKLAPKEDLNKILNNI